jgi:nitrous oxide reductase
MSEQRPSRMRRRGFVAAIVSAAAVAVALPISGALASGEDAPAPARDQAIQTQSETAPRDGSPRNHDGDCPDKDGRGGSASDTSVEL